MGQMAGGITKYLALDFPEVCTSSSQFSLNFSKLDNMINDKTKLLFINNPHNPTGKMWSHEELLELSKVVAKYPNLYVVADEAYEQLAFDGTPHIRFANMPGMFDKTITVFSAGKSFECTGWKIGWTVASEEVSNAIQMGSQWVLFCVASPLQYAIGKSLQKAKHNGWFPSLREKLQRRRDNLVVNLESAGLKPIVPQGGYFVMANTSKFDFQRTPGSPKDFDFCRWLIKTYGLGPIPPSAFYCKEHATIMEDYTRFAICKTDELIQEGCDKLKAIKV